MLNHEFHATQTKFRLYTACPMIGTPGFPYECETLEEAIAIASRILQKHGFDTRIIMEQKLEYAMHILTVKGA